MPRPMCRFNDLMRKVPWAAVMLVLCMGQSCAQIPQGAQELLGQNGTDAESRIYGDGSAGARTITAAETFNDANLQYTDFTVDAGAVLTIPSGATIRCTGTFTNNGAINVQTAAAGSSQATFFDGPTDKLYAPAEPGVSLRAATPGEICTGSCVGGLGGIGLSELQARVTLLPGVKAGGGGGGAFGFFDAVSGGSGGGSLTVLARTAIQNNANATINAKGADGKARAGGGAGGIIILASPGSINNLGSISVTGGIGGASADRGAAGGGGGGGIIHFLTPNASIGASVVSGGAGGLTVVDVTSNLRSGGGGGGACGGDGGAGESVVNLVTTGGEPGDPGKIVLTEADPTALFP